jgi:hypothetical protein
MQEQPPPITDREIAEWVASGFATDAYKTPDQAPIMSDRVLALLRPFAEAGVIWIDEGSWPMRQDGPNLVMGRGWASLTDKGRALLPPAKH